MKSSHPEIKVHLTTALEKFASVLLFAVMEKQVLAIFVLSSYATCRHTTHGGGVQSAIHSVNAELSKIGEDSIFTNHGAKDVSFNNLDKKPKQEGYTTSSFFQ